MQKILLFLNTNYLTLKVYATEKKYQNKFEEVCKSTFVNLILIVIFLYFYFLIFSFSNSFSFIFFGEPKIAI